MALSSFAFSFWVQFLFALLSLSVVANLLVAFCGCRHLLLFVSPTVCLSVCLTVCLSVRFVSLPVARSICLSLAHFGLFVDCFLHLILHYFYCTTAVLISAVEQSLAKTRACRRCLFFACVCNCLSVRLSGCLSVWLCLSMQSFVCFVEFLLSLLWLVKKCNKCFNGPNCPPTAGWQLAKNSISNQPFHSITPVALSLSFSLCVCCSPGAFEWHEQRVASFTCRLNATKCSVRHHYEHNYNYVHYAVLISTDESAKIFLMNTANTTRCECVWVRVCECNVAMAKWDALVVFMISIAKHYYGRSSKRSCK